MAQSLLIATIGTKLVKGLLSIWLGDKTLAKLASELSVDFFEKHTRDFYEARRAKRFFEELADRVSSETANFIDSEHKGLPRGDTKQIVDGTIEIISAPSFYDLCIAERLSYERVYQSCKPLLAAQAKQRAVSRTALDSIFRFILTEFLTILSSLPQFNRVAFRKILEDTEIINEKITRIQAKLEDVASSVDEDNVRHAHDYRREFARRFRKIQLFGVDSRGLEKRYDLSIGYISLSISSDDDVDNASVRPIEEVLASTHAAGGPFTLITGAAGSGKTTILSWLALNCADRKLPIELAALNSMIPIFIAFREYADTKLPRGSDLLTSQIGVLSDALDPKWIRQQLKAGKLLFLLDGFDEVNESRRDTIAEWVVELSDRFPDAKFVMTSRPYAAYAIEDQIAGQLDDFTKLQVEPMDMIQIGKFVTHWYDAYSHDAEDRQQLERLRAAHARLEEALASNSSLRSISSNPLLCALLCFVNADREGFVPTDRGDLYNIAAEALLERREKERKIFVNSEIVLTKQQKFKIIGFVAEYFFARRSVQLEQKDVAHHLKTFLPALDLEAGKSDQILKLLVERSQILRSPDDGFVDFSHKTFQEYFYARRIVDANLREQVAEKFFVSDKAEVILFVSALGPAEFVEFVIGDATRQLTKANKHSFREKVIFLHSCVTEASEISVDLRRTVAEKLREVLPPKTTEEAEGLGSAGRSIIEPLSRFANVRYRANWQHCATALVATMDEEAFPVLAMFARLQDKAVDDVLVSAKRFFESARYNQIVLANCIHITRLSVSDQFDFDLMKKLNGLVDVEINSYSDGVEGLPKKDGVLSLRLHDVRSIKKLELLRSFPMIRSLDISESPSIEEFSAIGYCYKLRHLRIESESAVSNLQFLAGLSELRTLDVSECLALTDVRVLNRLLKLEEVELPFAALYEQLDPRLSKSIELLDEDVDEFL